MKSLLVLLLLAITSVAQDRSTFRLMTPEDRTTVWANHFRIARLQSLTSDQRATIDYAMSMLTPSLFVNHKVPDTLTIQIRQRFTISQARSIFAELDQPIARRFAHFDESTPCVCNPDSDYCDLSCFGNGCTSSDYGCGTLWLYSCNGLCRKAEVE